MTDENIWLTTEQAAKVLQCSKGTLANLRSQGKGPRYYDVGAIRYLKADIDEWLKSHSVEPGEK